MDDFVGAHKVLYDTFKTEDERIEQNARFDTLNSRNRNHCADIDKKRTADLARQASTQSKETRRKAKSTQAGQCNTS